MRHAVGNTRFSVYTNTDIAHMNGLRDARLVAARFGELIESMPDAIVMLNATGRIVLVNAQTEAMFGYSRGALLGVPVETLLPQRFHANYVIHRAAFRRRPQTRTMGAGLELFGLRRDGEEFPVEISLSPLVTTEGMFVSSAIRDATESRLIQKRTQEASRMKSEFLANMSHELRTPLNGIIGFSEFLIDEKPGPLNAKQKEYLQDVLTSGQHLLHVINDVLDLSKVEAGRMDLIAARFDVPKAIEEVCSVVSPLALKKDITLEREIAPAVGSVILDRQRFIQVLYNLLSNALKFTAEGGHVRITADIHNKAQLRVQVEDNGIGIAPHDIGRLFIEFRQLDASTTQHYEGTGLGLALTKKLVEMQRGTIEVRSELGRGSTFTILLPLLAACHA